ncbi:MAG TPA: DoxX family protein [Acidimicrobiia bacterium]|nr:DoxX family protein [Acidimicrobiia bacterium]
MLRFVVGLLLVGHGTRKLCGWFGGGGLVGTAWYFRSIGYWPPRLMAGLAGGAELLGGACLAMGFLTPLAAAAVIGMMFSAAVAVHWRNGVWAIDNGYEYPLVIGAVAAALGFTGPGAASLDAWFGHGGASIASGAFAVVCGLVVGSAVLFTRTLAPSSAVPAPKSRSSGDSAPEIADRHGGRLQPLRVLR